MKRKRFAFVMDPLETLDLRWDTSLCLLRELKRLGHSTSLFLPSSLASNGTKIHGEAHGKKWNLADFDAVFIRKDPPFDGAYLALTYLLEPLAKKTQVINHPRGIRNANEKLFGLRFVRWSPPSLVTSRAEEIFSFQTKLRSEVVVKPLYEKGGKGVFRLRRSERGASRLLRQATRGEKEMVVAQKFIPVPPGTGDKRILLWKEKVLGVFERIPRPGEFRSNLSLGGSFRSCLLTKREKKLVQELVPELLKEGLYWTGIDVRQGWLLEVNVTSPAGLVELDQLYGGATARLAKYVGA